MKRSFLFWCIFPTALLGCKTQAETDWRGAYLYEHELGEGAGGISSFIEYNLTIADNKCTIDIVGLQTDDHILCTTKPSEDAVAVTFKSYTDGTTKNPLGIAVYDIGSTLFSLKKKNDSLITQWQSLVPDGLKKLSGEYFAKSTANR
ncbi:MAG TPA: DUF5991 domain-containing protein [Cellvibrio sp.]|nr:DUF5991 domain-containing protein [Cellvibrio sp.]